MSLFGVSTSTSFWRGSGARCRCHGLARVPVRSGRGSGSGAAWVEERVCGPQSAAGFVTPLPVGSLTTKQSNPTSRSSTPSKPGLANPGLGARLPAAAASPNLGIPALICSTRLAYSLRPERLTRWMPATPGPLLMIQPTRAKIATPRPPPAASLTPAGPRWRGRASPPAMSYRLRDRIIVIHVKVPRTHAASAQISSCRVRTELMPPLTNVHLPRNNPKPHARLPPTDARQLLDHPRAGCSTCTEQRHNQSHKISGFPRRACTRRSLRPQTHRQGSGKPAHWHDSTLAHWHTGTLVVKLAHEQAGTLAHWQVGTPASWHTGTLAHRRQTERRKPPAGRSIPDGREVSGSTPQMRGTKLYGATKRNT